ncbi:hypothetical protein EVAR_53429_1 [Eumeta japonica]|uniref:Uncharacterized protein n=1 Tax=Eumeta variegata TaxID=151549 RepID=A0A4C1Y3E1_EUMVA|nr:hypothetical protein EVAR_53429_1 [Eumeta japonica]
MVLGSFFFHPRKSGCPISGYADGNLEVHSVPLLRQPQLATFLLTYLPVLPTVEVSSQMRDQEQIQVEPLNSSVALTDSSTFEYLSDHRENKENRMIKRISFENSWFKLQPRRTN